LAVNGSAVSNMCSATFFGTDLATATPGVEQNSPVLTLPHNKNTAIILNKYDLCGVILVFITSYLSQWSRYRRVLTDYFCVLSTSPMENWRRPPVCHRTIWMKTTQRNLKSNKLSLMSQSTWLRIVPSGD